MQTVYNKKWPIKPIKVPFKNQSNGCTAYLKPSHKALHCTEVRLTSVQSTTARFVESVHFFLVILVILLTAEPVRILKMEVTQVSNFEFFPAEPVRLFPCLSVSY